MTRLRRLIPLALAATACAAPAAVSTPPPPATSAPTSAPAVAPLTPTAPPTVKATTTVRPVTAAPTVSAPAIPNASCCRFELIAGGLVSPVYLTHAGDDRLFVLEQSGRILVIADGQLLDAPFLDIVNLVGSRANEQGLLGLAFHPDYSSNGHFFVNYTDVNGDTAVARYTVSADPDRADPSTAKILLRIDQPFANHNGGDIVFGPEGLLYIGMGDGGSAGDPRGNAQNPASLLGKLLTLDVDTPGAQPEIWASGLRNPWRFSFDRLTGDLFIADVGQGKWEEINFVPWPLASGLNFGWNFLEGSHPYRGLSGSGLTPPVAEYSHSEGGCSVTGGYVYRGRAIPSLQGAYFFGDFCSGLIWSLTRDAAGAWQRNLFERTDFLITSFGEDASGELYVLDRAGGVYRLVER